MNLLTPLSTVFSYHERTKHHFDRYLLVRDPAKKDLHKHAMRESFAWLTPSDTATEFPLYLLFESDCRDVARQLSCHQDRGECHLQSEPA